MRDEPSSQVPPGRTMRRIAQIRRPLLIAAGCICVVLGAIGLVLPIMPGTIFLILAAACFAKSSPRFENWLINHPRLGPPVIAWRRSGAIPTRAKIIAISMMALSFAIAWAGGAPGWALVLTAVALGGSALYVGTRPAA